MKKILCMICLLVLSVSLLSSCSLLGGGSEDKDFENAKKAFELLEEAEEICIEGMDDIYGAWYFGIYDADDSSTYSVFNDLALQTSFSASDLRTNGGFEGKYLVNGLGDTSEWQYCLWTVQNCLEKRGDFDKVDELLSQSKTYIQSLSSDYTYTADFKDYYAKVASYAEFFKNTTGSFKQLQTTVADYENSIRTAKESFKFDFE